MMTIQEKEKFEHDYRFSLSLLSSVDLLLEYKRVLLNSNDDFIELVEDEILNKMGYDISDL